MFDNSVEMDDNTEMESRYKLKIQELENRGKKSFSSLPQGVINMFN